MTILYDKQTWELIFHIFMFGLILNTITQKLWNNSKTTVTAIIGFQIFIIMLPTAPIGITYIYLMLLMMYMYLNAVKKPKKLWSKYEYINREKDNDC